MAFALLAATLIGPSGPAGTPSPLHAAGTRPQESGSPAEALFRDYRSVPGVTQEEIDDIERLKRGRSFLVYGSCPTTEAFVSHDGRVGGFSAHMASWLSVLFGIDVQPRVYDWDRLIEGLESGEVDFTGELTPTEERRSEYLMTPPIAERGTKYFRISGSPPLDEIAERRRLRFAFLSGTVTQQAVAEASDRPFDPIETLDYASAYLLLSTGLADAFIDESPAEAAFDSHGDVIAEDFMPVIYSDVSLATRNRELKSLVSVVTKAIEAGTNQGLMELYVRGTADYKRHKYTLLLSPDELRFLERRIASGDPILFAAEDDNYPVAFLNVEEGEFQGIALDVLREISKISGLAFEPVNSGPSEWTALLRTLDEGRASVITELIRSPDREGRYLWTDPPYSGDKYAMISLSATPDRNLSEILLSDVGLVTGTAWANAFRTWFRNHPRTREYATTDQAFAALERGEIELLMGTRNLNLGMTNYRERTGFKVNHVFDVGFESNFGLNIHETMVRSLISKAIPLVDCQAITDRWLQRSFDYRGTLARSRVPWLAGLAAFLVLLLAFSSSYMRRKSRESKELELEVQDRTAEIAGQREEAYRQLKARGDFLARMSHEIRTPMNAIIGMAELALRERIPDEASEMISNILRAGNSLLTIINDILDFSKIESGRMEIVPAEYRLGQLVSDAVGIAGTRLSGKPVEFLVEADPRLPATLFGDELRIRQVMLNLLSNAAKYTKTGWVRLRVETGTRLSPDGLCAWPRRPSGETCEWHPGMGPPATPSGEFCVWPPPDPADRAVGDADTGPADAPGPDAPGPAASAAVAAGSAGPPPRLEPPDATGRTGPELSGAGAAGRTGPELSGADAAAAREDGVPERVVLRIEVSDSGIGIRPEDMSKLFGTFAQVDQRANRGIEGTGLGLAITRNLAALMGGTVTARSEYGKGSAFTAEIPQDVRCPYVPLAALKDSSDARALFLEPDPARAESLEWTLARLGASWEIAGDPVSFKNLLRGGSFAYVFAQEEDELLAAGLISEAGSAARPVYLSPPGQKPERIPGALSCPRPLWSLPLSKILNDEQDARPVRELSNAALTAPTARALVVDDLTVNLKVARGLLGPFKVEVDTCESGAEAVRLADERAYDIIFMDHVMPGMDGIEATERIRSGPNGRQVPIIALTANAVSGMREMFMSHGMNGFISKPIETGKLEAALRDWLPPDKIVKQPAPEPPSNGGAKGAKGHKPLTSPAAPDPAPAPAKALRPDKGGEHFRDGGFDPDASLAQLAGDHELMLEVLELYVDSTPALLDRIRGLDPDDVGGCATAFHTIKGASLNVGARKVGEMAASLEKAAKEGDAETVLQNCHDFIETVEGLLWQMTSYLKHVSPAH
jgi:signal transduction histidine kinase/CheY-like chemotaxis protein/HPt (histidine-containing phosphotransfer) domain-containing protein